MFADLIFYVFAAVLLLSAMGVVVARNPIFSVLFLILCFFNCAGLFVLLGAEFLGLLLVLVYVGAIAVMFLFVLMTIDIDFAMLKEGTASYLPVGLLVGGLMVTELVLAAKAGVFSGEMVQQAMPIPGDVQNIVAIGQVLFTDYFAPFQLAGLILLTAMIGAIVLTFRRREGVRRQNINQQVLTRREDAVELKKVKSGQGLV